MNSTQRVLVISALVIISIVLAFVMLEWSDGRLLTWSGGRVSPLTRIVVFYEKDEYYEVPYLPYVANRTHSWGIYTRFGIPGILFGLVTPLCLLTVAAYVFFSRRPSQSS